MSNSARDDYISPTHSALQALELLSVEAGVAFDRLVAARVLGEAEQTIGGDDPDAWSSCMVEVGESLNLRIRNVTCRFFEVVSLANEGVPVAFCRSLDATSSNEQGEDSEATPGHIRWTVIHRGKGRKLRVSERGLGGPSRLLTPRELRKVLGLSGADSEFRAVIGQSALACSAPATVDAAGRKKPLSPLGRLIGLIRPEKRDLWVLLVFALIVGVLALATPVAVEALVNTVAFGKYIQPVVILSLLLFVFLAFAAMMRALIAYVVEIFQRRLFLRVVEDLAYRLPRARREQFDNGHAPEAVNRFFDIVTAQKAASALLVDGLAIVLQTIIGMAVLAFYHPFLLGFDVVLLVCVGLIVFGLGRGAVKTAIKESKAKYEIAAWLEEVVRHPTAFTMHSGHQFALDRADQLAIGWLDRRRSHFRVLLRQILFALGLQAVAATALLGLGGWLVILGELTLGQLVAAELIVMMIVGSFAKLGKHMESFYDLLASVDKLGQLFDLKTEPHDKLFHLREGDPAGLNISRVTYKYGNNSGLAGCDIDVMPGESVAVVGAAGSGKTTLFDLLCGLRDPSSGHIELDGIDLRELRPDSLREHLALSRQVEIFAGTIDENVRLHRPNVRANDVRDALEAVGLLDELLGLPDGLNTKLATDGGPLSHSQSLRLMIARAIAGRPRLLLIDGTLDGLSDASIERLLPAIMGPEAPWTTLIATGKKQVRTYCSRVVEVNKPNAPAVKTPAETSSTSRTSNTTRGNDHG